jgi:hypothetical protein
MNRFHDAAGFLQNSGIPGPMGDKLSGLGSVFGQMMEKKGKGAPQQPANMQPTAVASPGFNQPVDQSGRSALLQAMMQRSRMGRGQGA